MKAMYNVILIILLAFGLTTIPLFLSPIDYSHSIDLEPSSPSEKKIEFNSLSGYSLENPNTLAIEVSCNREMTLSKPQNALYTLEIYQASELFKKIDAITLSSSNFENQQFLIKESSPFKSILDLNQAQLSLPNGEYQIVIIPQMSEVSDQKIELDVRYTLDGKYMNALNEAPENTSGFTLYLSDENDVLIPVTVFMKADLLPHKMLLSLYETESLVDPLSNPMGAINYIILRDRVIYIDVPAKDAIYNLQNIKAQNAYWAFVKTFSRLEGVVKVRFTVDNLVLEEFFYGKNIRYAIDYDPINKIYLPVLVSDRYYLSDLNVENAESLSPEERLNAINTAIKDYFRIDYTYSLDQSTLEINFDDSTFQLNLTPDKRDMIIESILYSCTSMPEIESIKIDDEVIFPPKYINPII